MRLAEARMAADYVARAQAWSQAVDDQIAAELGQLHQRILRRVDELSFSAPGARRRGPQLRS
jgi:hypothetical protein